MTTKYFGHTTTEQNADLDGIIAGGAQLTALPGTGRGVATLKDYVGNNADACVLDWNGVRNDGTGDSTLGLIAAITGAAAARSTSNASGIYGGGGPRLRVPRGVYNVSGAVPLQPYLDVLSEGAIINQLDPNQDIFTAVGYSNRFHRVICQGGRRHWSIATANTDTTLIHIDQCESLGYSGDAIYSDTNSNSTQCVVSRHKFYSTGLGARVFNWQTGDFLTIRDIWVTMGPTAEIFRFVGAFAVTLERMIGVPITNAGCWIRNEGCTLRVRESKFGAEGSGGRTILKNYANADLTAPIVPISIELEKNDVYVFAGGNAMEFYALPNRFVWRGNQGLSDPAYVYIDPAVSNAQAKLIGGRITMDVDSEQMFGNLLPFSRLGHQFANAARSVANERRKGFTGFSVADRVLAIQPDGSFGQANTLNSVAYDNSTFSPSGARLAIFTASANDGNFVTSYATALTGLAAGMYTAVFDVRSITVPTLAVFTVADRVVPKVIQPGQSIIAIPFNFDSSFCALTLGVSLSGMANGQVFTLGLVRVIKGDVDVTTEQTICWDTVANVPTTGRWFSGDRVMLAVPNADGNDGYSCVAANGGAVPGTWTVRGSTTSGTFTPHNPQVTLTSNTGSWRRTGNLVHVTMDFTLPATADANAFTIDNLPFAASAANHALSKGFTTSTSDVLFYIGASTAVMNTSSPAASGAAVTNATLSTKRFIVSGAYEV